MKKFDNCPKTIDITPIRTIEYVIYAFPPLLTKVIVLIRAIICDIVDKQDK